MGWKLMPAPGLHSLDGPRIAGARGDRGLGRLRGWAPLERTTRLRARRSTGARSGPRPWAFAEGDAWQWHVHAFVLRTPTSTILVDSGAGAFGQLVRWAEARGGRVVGARPRSGRSRDLTHLHADHAGGTVVGDGEARFPNARYHAHPADWRHFGERPDGSGYDARAAMSGLQASGQVSLDADDREVTPGVRVVHSPGHTPGHRTWWSAGPNACCSPATSAPPHPDPSPGLALVP